MSYWQNNDKVQLSQTQVSIPSTNGLSYSGTAGTGGRRVDFEIPPSVKFLDGKNSYLQFDIKLGMGAVPTRLQLDPFIGGQSVVKNLRIYSGNRAVLLEEISDYNVKVQMQYSYNQDESIRQMRALKEGSLVPTIKSRGNLGTSVSNNIDITTNPYYKPISAYGAAGAGSPDFVNGDYLTAKVSLPIHSGIFADSTKVFPVMATQGLYIEVDLEDPGRIIKQLDSVNKNRRMQQNPLFHGVDVAGTNMPTGATDYTDIFLSQLNSVQSIEQCPFVKGETIGICSKTDPLTQANLTKADGTSFHPKITDITLVDSGGAAGSFVKLTVESFRNSAVGTGVAVTTDNFIIYSTAIDQKRVEVAAGKAQILAPITQYAATYEISNMEIVCQQVELDPRYEQGMMAQLRDGGSIELDIHSATNYRHSLLSSNRNATVNLAVSNTRAKSCIVVPTDATVYNTAQLIGGLSDTYDEERLTMDGRLHSIRSHQVGVIDKLSSYQFMIDDKLVPSRPIDVSKINGGKSISAQPLIELEKALNQAKVVPRSFCDYNRNFCIGRAYALNDGVMNLNNKTNQLQLFYNESTVAGVDEPPVKDKLLMAFIYHVRRISIKGDSVSVTL